MEASHPNRRVRRSGESLAQLIACCYDLRRVSGLVNQDDLRKGGRSFRRGPAGRFVGGTGSLSVTG